MPGPPDTPCCRAARACSPTLCVNPNPARRGGPQVVVTAADASEAPAGRMDAAALDRIAIRVSPRVFGTRIRCVREEADVAKEVRRPPGPRAGGWNAGGGGGGLGLCRLWEADRALSEETWIEFCRALLAVAPSAGSSSGRPGCAAGTTQAKRWWRTAACQPMGLFMCLNGAGIKIRGASSSDHAEKIRTD